jgi:hypothetical protein
MKTYWDDGKGMSVVCVTVVFQSYGTYVPRGLKDIGILEVDDNTMFKTSAAYNS